MYDNMYIIILLIVLYIFVTSSYFLINCRVKTNGNWGSHIPILVTVLNHTNGDILELGSGYYSTPVIHQYASKDRNVITVESDGKWMAFFKDRFSTKNHTFHCTNTFKSNLYINEILYRLNPIEIDLTHYENNAYSNKKFDVAFIDHAPSYRRYKDIMQLRNNCKIIIVHDTDDTIINRIVFGHEMQDIFRTFKYVFRTNNIKPQTTVLSDVYDVKKLLEYYNF